MNHDDGNQTDDIEKSDIILLGLIKISHILCILCITLLTFYNLVNLMEKKLTIIIQRGKSEFFLFYL